ncbi:MAG: hypothetical protein U5L09_02390 [Bacteroidales bacterium]|nr:hypothetical protein [Bacteroidales bacterium]
MKTTKRLAVIMLTFIIPLYSLGQAMTAQKVIDKVKDTYQKQIEGIEDITKITNNGAHYQKWERSGEGTTYKLRNEQDIDGTKQISIYDGTYFWTKEPYSGEVTKTQQELNPVVFYEHLESWDFSYSGKEQLDGATCHVLETTGIDLDKMINPTTGQPIIDAGTPGMENATADARIYVHAGDWVIKQMDFEVQNLRLQNRERTISSTVRYEDYRNVEGLLVAWRTTTEMQVSMTDQEREQMKEARKSMKEMQQQMKDMSESERKMMEQHMKPQMEKMRQGMQFLSGEMNEVEKVQEVKINTGISGDLFDGTKL